MPGPIDRPNSEGPNRLIADGASVIVEAGPRDIFAARGSLPAEPELRELLAVVPPAPATIDEVASLVGRPCRSGCGPQVTVLELRGFLTPTRDGRVMRTPGRP